MKEDNVKLVAGKRYSWLASNEYGAREYNGLFTGEYNKMNGNAILMTKNGDQWSIPPRDCKLIQKKGK